MKTTRNLIALVIGVMAVFFTACKKDDVPGTTFGKPVVNKDFTVSVNGNKVLLNCSNPTMTSVMWQVSNGSQSTDKSAEVYVPVAGDYSVVLNVSNGGDFLASDTVKFAIATSDAAFFQTGLMKALTGGPGAKKTWRLDLIDKVTTAIDDAGNVTTTTSHISQYFHNPLDFYGDATAGGSATNVWGPWGGTNIYGWGGTPELGDISFDATSGKVTLTVDGVQTQGKYGVNLYDRPADFCTITANNNNGAAISLWDHMLANKYSYLHKLSSQMADIKFSSGLRFPIDKGRLTNDANATYPSQFLKSDLENVTIMHCTDSSLVVRVKRTYEGDKESKCWLLYNYVVKEYNYGNVTVPTHPVKTTGTITAGSYVLAPAPGNWIGWSNKTQLNTWADRAAFLATMKDWWQFGDPSAPAATTNMATCSTALGKTTLTFGPGTALKVHNAEYNNGAYTESDLTTTYSMNKPGYITFGDSVSVYAVAASLKKVKHVYIVDVAGSTNLWLGINNGDKAETQAIQLVPKP